MKTESHVLAGQREPNCHEERKRKPSQNLNFLSDFLLLFLTYLFVGFVSTVARLAWDHFSELTQKWGPQLSWLVFNCRLNLMASSSQLALHPSHPLTSAWCPRRNILVSGGWTPAQKIWDRGHLPMTGWPTMSALAWHIQVSCSFRRLFFLIILCHPIGCLDHRVGHYFDEGHKLGLSGHLLTLCF